MPLRRILMTGAAGGLGKVLRRRGEASLVCVGRCEFKSEMINANVPLALALRVLTGFRTQRRYPPHSSLFDVWM